jgi:GMC oxidoreductase
MQQLINSSDETAEVYKYFYIRTLAFVYTYSIQADTAIPTCTSFHHTLPKQLRIKGLKNIRIVDASVIPTLPGGQTGAVTVMIAEKASDIILKK